MESRTKRSMSVKKSAIAIGAIGLIAAPLIAINGSASIDSGAFQIRAENTSDRSIYAVSGMALRSTLEPGDPRLNDCGPMTIDLTSNIDGLSLNEIDRGATRTSQALNADGIAIVDRTTGSNGFCDFKDYRILTVGSIVEHVDAPNDYRTDARVVDINGTLAIERQLKTDQGLTEIRRFDPTTVGGAISPIGSSEIPSIIIQLDSADSNPGQNWYAQGHKRIVVFGQYDSVHVEGFDGSTIEYRNSNRSDGGPRIAKWDSNGSFIGYFNNVSDSFVGQDLSDSNFTESSVEEWNSANSTNWNGAKSDLDAQHLTGNFNPAF